MVWGRVCDQLHDHPKVEKAGVAAMGLWVLAMSYSNNKLSNGFVSFARAVKLCDSNRALATKLIAKLVAARLWHPTNEECDDALCNQYRTTEEGWRFHDWGQCQPARDEVMETRSAKNEARRAAGRIGGKRSGEARRAAREAEAFASFASSKGAGLLPENEANAKQTQSKTEPPIPYPIPEEKISTRTDLSHPGTLEPTVPSEVCGPIDDPEIVPSPTASGERLASAVALRPLAAAPAAPFQEPDDQEQVFDAEIVLRELRRHPALERVADVRMAESIAGRLMSLPAFWGDLKTQISACARDAANEGPLLEPHLRKKLGVYCDNAHRRRREASFRAVAGGRIPPPGLKDAWKAGSWLEAEPIK
jgi:hypothetical protein